MGGGGLGGGGMGGMGAGGMGGMGGMGGVSLPAFKLTPQQGLLLSTIELQNLLSQFGKVNAETAKSTVEWLTSLKKEVDPEKLTEQFRDPNLNSKIDVQEVYQICLNQACDEAIKGILQSSGN